MELKQAIQTVIGFLDEKMQESPNQKVADASNLLEEFKAEL